jgi:hypothetical protein
MDSSGKGLDPDGVLQLGTILGTETGVSKPMRIGPFRTMSLQAQVGYLFRVGLMSQYDFAMLVRLTAESAACVVVFDVVHCWHILMRFCGRRYGKNM